MSMVQQGSEQAQLLGLLVDGTVNATALMGVAWLSMGLLRKASSTLRHVVLVGAFAGTLVFPAVRISSGTLPWVSGVSDRVISAVIAVWAVGVLVAWISIARDLRGLRRLWRRSRPASEFAWARDLSAEGETLMVSKDITVPLMFGWRRPVVMLPEGAQTWSDAVRRTALAHERAHGRRGDWIVMMGARVVKGLLWFHPGMWWLHRRLILEAERAADASVVRSGQASHLYARHLLELCEGVLRRQSANAAAMSLLTKSQLSARVGSLVAPGGPRKTESSLWLILAASAGVACSLPVGSSEATVTDLAAAPEAEAPQSCQPEEYQAQGPMLMMEYVKPLAARKLVENCPLSRAGVQVVWTVETTLRGQDIRLFAHDKPLEAAHEEVLRLSSRLARQVNAYGVYDLAPPTEGSYLAESPLPLHTPATLKADPDPIAATSETIGQVLFLAEALPEETLALLESARDTLGEPLIDEGGRLALIAALERAELATQYACHEPMQDCSELFEYRRTLLRLKNLLEQYGDTLC